jgi:transposase InsO family protein
VIAEYQQEHPDASVRRMCQALGVSRSWLYERPAVQEPTEEDTRLRDAIRLRDAVELLCLSFPGYGYRRVTAQLHRDGWTVNHKRVLQVMREESLLCRLRKAFRPPSPGSTRAAYPNLLKGVELTGLDQAWVVDITYIRLPQGFVYLACVLDAFSRRCIGWHLSRDIDTALTLAALEAAISARRPGPGLIHHSDRGVQYASLDYVARLHEIGACLSMSAAGCPYDNAKAESFFKTLKREEVYLNQYQNFEAALENIGAFLEDVYNVKRLHSSLGYLPPAEFEEAFVADQARLTANLALASKS